MRKDSGVLMVGVVLLLLGLLNHYNWLLCFRKESAFVPGNSRRTDYLASQV
jgi:hypothetical protein